MVWLTFSFLLGIPHVNKDKKDKPSEEKLKGQKKYKEIEVSKPQFSCHIEYVLLPENQPKFVDIVSWEGAAKIYYENTTSAITPFVIGKIEWIHFRINHRLKLGFDDIPVLHSHNIKFTITIGVKKLGSPAKNDNVRKFYGPSESSYSIKKQIFQPLSEKDTELTAVGFHKEHLTSQQQLYVKLDTTAEIYNHFGKLYKRMVSLSDEYNSNTRQKTTIPSMEEPPWVNINDKENENEASNVNEEDLEKKNSKEKKSQKKEASQEKKNKKGTKKETGEDEIIEFVIPGEALLSGQSVFEYCLKYTSKDMPFFYCLASVKNMLTKSQIKFFNPFSVNVDHINFLPVKKLVASGVSKIKLQIIVCEEYLAESNPMSISDKMNISFIRTLLTNNINNSKLIYFIQTGGLKINILGSIQEKKEETKEKIYKIGSLNNKNVILKAKVLDKPKNGFILIGTISVDISSLLFPPFQLLVKCNVSPASENIYRCIRQSNDGALNVNELNASCERKKYRVFWDSYKAPMLTVKIMLGHSLTNIERAVAANPNLLNRLFAVFYNLQLATQVIGLIQSETNEFLQPLDYLRYSKNVQRPMSHKNLSNWDKLTEKNNVQMTGFVVDCIDKVLIFVEGPVCSGIKKIWTFSSMVHPKEGRVLYDSSLIFTERLYEKFFRFGGFLTLSLAECPSNSKTFTENKIPEPAWKALISLRALIECRSIKAAIKNNYFPDVHCLTSLAVECGVPIQMCDNIYQNP